jgi:hypothetical protein
MIPSFDLDKRNREIAALAGAAAYAKTPSVLEPVTQPLQDVLERRVTGVPIKAKMGTPLEQLAEFTRREAETIKAFAAERGVTAPIVAAGPKEPMSFFAQERGGLDALYDDWKKRTGPKPVSHIGLTRTSVPQAFHEIGHAAPIAGSHGARRGFQSVVGHMGKGSRFGTALRGLLLANVLVPPGLKSGELRHKAYEYAPHIMGASVAPGLIEEARASTQAIMGAKKHGVGAQKAMRELLPAFATHAAKAVTPVLAVLVAKKLVQLLGKGAEKKAAAIPAAAPKAPGALRVPASAAWYPAASPPKPKSIRPSRNPALRAKETPVAKPSSKTAFYRDMIESLHNPGRGARITKAG